MSNTLYRVAGHAGRWLHMGQAVVVTDEDTFEHDMVVMAQMFDPDNVVVVDPADVTPFAPTADDPVQPIAV